MQLPFEIIAISFIYHAEVLSILLVNNPLCRHPFIFSLNHQFESKNALSPWEMFCTEKESPAEISTEHFPG